MKILEDMQSEKIKDYWKNFNNGRSTNEHDYSEKKKELCRTLEKGSVDFQKLPNESKVPKKE